MKKVIFKKLRNVLLYCVLGIINCLLWYGLKTILDSDIVNQYSDAIVWLILTYFEKYYILNIHNKLKLDREKKEIFYLLFCFILFFNIILWRILEICIDSSDIFQYSDKIMWVALSYFGTYWFLGKCYHSYHRRKE